MRSIADEAGISIQLLIHHVENKEKLWQYVMEHFAHRYDEYFEQEDKDNEEGTSSEQLRAALKKVVLYHAATPEIHRIMVQEGGVLSPRMVWLTENLTKKGYDAFLDKIKAAQSDGAVNECSPAQLYYAIIGMSATSFSVKAEYEYLTGTNPFSESEVDRLVELISKLVFK